MTAPTALDKMSPAPGVRHSAPVPAGDWEPTSVTTVLLVGARDTPSKRVRRALVETWRAAGRPLVVRTPVPGGLGELWAREWTREHKVCGIRFEAAEPGRPGPDVWLLFDPCPAARAAFPAARAAGIQLIDGWTAGDRR